MDYVVKRKVLNTLGNPENLSKNKNWKTNFYLKVFVLWNISELSFTLMQFNNLMFICKYMYKRYRVSCFLQTPKVDTKKKYTGWKSMECTFFEKNGKSKFKNTNMKKYFTMDSI